MNAHVIAYVVNRANAYLSGMAARGFEPNPETVARYRAEIDALKGQ